MMTNSNLTKTLSEDVFASLDRFFSIASANGVECVTLDCVTRKVNVEMRQYQEEEEGEPESYFLKFMEAFNAEDKAKALFAHWKRRQIVNPTIALYQKFVGKQLEDVLKCGFIVLDEWFDTDDYANYDEELAQWGLTGKGYEPRYYMLRQLMNYERGRFEVNQTVTGRYLHTRNEKLTKEGMTCFSCFVHMCQLVNAKMDELEGATDSLSSADKALLRRILGYVPRGDWRMPATYENISLFLEELFENIEFRDFFKDGKAGADTDRVEVSMANILGYLMSHQLLTGGQKQISMDFFGNESHVNNINKGKNGDGNQTFKNIIPLMDKYRAKVIGQITP